MEVKKSVEFIQKIRKFSDENIHATGSRVDPKFIDDCETMLLTHVYANGVDADDKGYVSIELEIFLVMLMYIYGYEISCFVSVVDAAGYKRFPTSYAFTSEWENALPTDNHFPSFFIDRVIKREILLREPEELLPEDCLTLHYRVIVSVMPYLQRYYRRDSSIHQSFLISNGENRLLLDSTLGKRLIEVSSCFRSLSETLTSDKESGYVNIPPEETYIFKTVCDILLGQNLIYLERNNNLFEIYVTADKYDVPVAMETCRCILSLLYRAAKIDDLIKVRMEKDILQFRELTETRYDIRLKEIVDGFLEGNYDDNHNDCRTVERAADNPEAVWRLVEVGVECSYFVFIRGSQDYTERDFGFYQ